MLVVVGGMAMFGVRLPFGRLPGDIVIQGDLGTIYIPLGTMLVVSVILTVVLSLIGRR